MRTWVRNKGKKQTRERGRERGSEREGGREGGGEREIEGGKERVREN